MLASLTDYTVGYKSHFWGGTNSTLSARLNLDLSSFQTNKKLQNDKWYHFSSRNKTFLEM
jgi:hypothetical protein